MPGESWTAVGISLLPAFFFLQGLWFLDIYRLLGMRRVLTSVGWGTLAAILVLPINTAANNWLGNAYLQLGAPLLEEVLKASILFVWIQRNRIGFLVDAAILGFAIGTGFASAENLLYWQTISGGTTLLWVVRGCGTAMMHGVCTACVAILALALSESKYSRRFQIAASFAPSFAIHIFYNSGLISTTVMAESMIILGVGLMFIVFTLSERMLITWLQKDLNRDIELWDMLRTGDLSGTEAGRYLDRLRTCFSPETMDDLLRLVRISLELRTRAKGEMMLRQHGIDVEPDPALAEDLHTLAKLEQNVGLAGRRALVPLIGGGGRRVWEIERLKETSKKNDGIR